MSSSLLMRCGSRRIAVPGRIPGRCRSASTAKPPLRVVDLRGAGWSLLERLCVEEFLTQTQTDTTLVIGRHEPTMHRFLQMGGRKAPAYIEAAILAMDENYNPSCAILVADSADLDLELVQRDGVLCVTGPSPLFAGESVVVDHASLLTTWIGPPTGGDPAEFLTQRVWKPTLERMEAIRVQSPAAKLGPMTMVLDTKSCSKGDNGGRLVALEDVQPTNTATTWSCLPQSLSLRRPNSLLLGDALVGKIHSDGTLVRSVFWWDYDGHYLSYLRAPSANAAKLRDWYGPSTSQLMEVLSSVCGRQYQVTQITTRDITRLMADEKTSLQDWWDHRSQWKIVQQF